MEAVIFDMDGVAIDSELHWKRAEARFLEARLPMGRQLDLNRLVGLSMEGFHRALTRDHGLEMDYPSFARLYREMAMEIYGKDVELMPGFEPLVDALRAEGARIALASSSPMEFVGLVVDRFGLGGRLDAIATADMVGGEGKPSPAVYLAGLHALGAPASGCVAVEDSRNGVAAAKAAGLACVALRNGFNDEQDLSSADLEVRSLGELGVGRLRGLVEARR